MDQNRHLPRVTLHQAEHKPLLLYVLHLPDTTHWGSLHPSEDPASAPFGSCGPNLLAQTSLHPTAVLLPQVLHADSHSCCTHPAVLTAIYIKNMKQQTLPPSSVTAQVLYIAEISSHCTEVWTTSDSTLQLYYTEFFSKLCIIWS